MPRRKFCDSCVKVNGGYYWCQKSGCIELKHIYTQLFDGGFSTTNSMGGFEEWALRWIVSRRPFRVIEVSKCPEDSGFTFR